MTCILSTLTFLSDLVSKCGMPTVVTFDQPLFWKASIIIKSITLMLGTFHMTMNLLGCIGVLLEKTGLSDVLEQIYAENAVIHILKGKAYSRALRGNLLAYMALNVVLINTFDDE